MENIEGYFSIVIPVFNRAELLRATLDSVLAQDYDRWECLLIDDGSDAETKSVLAEYEAKDYRFRQLYQRPGVKGAQAARNAGMQGARGRWVIFLDSDDLMAPDCLSGRMIGIHLHPGANLYVFNVVEFCDRPGDRNRQYRARWTNPLLLFLSMQAPWLICSTVWERNFLMTTGGFDESFRRLQDAELHTRALLHHDVRIKRFTRAIPDVYIRVSSAKLDCDMAAFVARQSQAQEHFFCTFFPLSMTSVHITPSRARRCMKMSYLRAANYAHKFMLQESFERLSRFALENHLLSGRCVSVLRFLLWRGMTPFLVRKGFGKYTYFLFDKMMNLYYFRVLLLAKYERPSYHHD